MTRQFSTPMMKQYIGIKKKYPDCLLFFRLGDFYELFLEDAVVGAQILNITLTKRPRGKDGHIPMAGVPFHAAENYIHKLIKAGQKVAICEQVSEPDKKGIVEREVVRVITPGTVLSSKSLADKESNYTMALSWGRRWLGIAFADISTGEFLTTQIEKKKEAAFFSQIARFLPVECILSPQDYQQGELLKKLSTQPGLNIYPFSEWKKFSEDSCLFLKEHFQVATLSGFCLAGKKQATIAAAVLLGYLKSTQLGKIVHLKPVKFYYPDEFLILDKATIVNLELFATLGEKNKKGTLIYLL
ncbi:DNA mismatch repair protein MutS, partial [Patescibacteria group bacterium]